MRDLRILELEEKLNLKLKEKTANQPDYASFKLDLGSLKLLKSSYECMEDLGNGI